MIVGIGYHLYSNKYILVDLNEKFISLTSDFDKLNEENKTLESDIEYYSNPRNLEKELRSRFNYRAPNEKMIIVVPSKEE